MSVDWPSKEDHGEGCAWPAGKCDCGLIDQLRALNAKRQPDPLPKRVIHPSETGETL